MVVKETEDRPPFTIRAREAELQASPDEGRLVVRFEQLRGIGGQIDIEWPETFEHVMSLDELTGNSSSNRSPSTVALGEIPDAKRRLEESIAHIEQQMTADATFGLLTGQFDALSKESWATHEKKLSAAEYRLQRLHTEPYRRWAGGFSCLCFVMIGAPMAIRLRHSEFLASFFACFLPILLIYYPLLMVSVDKAKSGELPPQAVWLGNIVLCVWGFWLMRRVMRY